MATAKQKSDDISNPRQLSESHLLDEICSLSPIGHEQCNEQPKQGKSRFGYGASKADLGNLPGPNLAWHWGT